MSIKKHKMKLSFCAVLWRELNIIQKRKKAYLFVLIIVETICAGMLPYLNVQIPKCVIDMIQVNENSEFILKSLPFLFGALMVLTIFSQLCNSQFDGAFVELRMNELTDLHKKYQELEYYHLEDPSFIDKAQAAMQALSNPVGFEGVYRNFIKLCPCVLTICIYGVLLCSFEPLVALICVGSTLLSIYVNGKIAEYINARKKDRARAERQKDYFNYMSYDFSYGKDIRVFSLGNKLNQEYNKKSEQFLNIISEISKKQWRLGLGELLFIFVKDFFAFLFIVRGYINGALTLGEVTLYMGVILSLSATLTDGTETFLKWIKCLTYASNYFQFMDDQSVYLEYGNKKRIPKEETLDIEFRNVSFRYPNTDKWILKHFNLKISKGEKLAIVGVNGAGKTTIIKLLTRLYPVTEGEIFINGININEFDTKEYQAMFSAVYQEVKIYAASVLENIIGDQTEEAERTRGKECLQVLGLGEKIETLPQKYDTPLLKVIDENGVELSGGQNQKLSIARALYKNANIIILDEPTAALDALAESSIYQSFHELVGNKTAIYISHRLSSTTFCDKIMLFSPEGILEYGDHETLMSCKGEYFHMFETQGKYYRGGVENE